MQAMLCHFRPTGYMLHDRLKPVQAFHSTKHDASCSYFALTVWDEIKTEHNASDTADDDDEPDSNLQYRPTVIPQHCDGKPV